ncbi:hypothetical protein BCR42DRAFT_307314, partial [Absidia repens]
IYSQRNLSIKGRVTITNILVLSKLWYCLRLTPVPQTFFNKLRSLVHRFVWQKKTPMLSYVHLCRTKYDGGLALLDSPRQQLILQARWLKNLLVPSFHSSLVTNMLHHYLSLAGPPDSPSLLPLLFPHLRYGALTSPHHVLSLIFKAFDGLRLDLDFDKATSDLCLHLPLT